MLSPIPQWVAVYVRSRSEKRVAELMQRVGVENYLPIVSRLHKWSDRYKMVDEPLFKSYVFAKIKKSEVSIVREIDGVVEIVGFGGEIVTVPEEQIATIKSMVDANQELSVMQSDALQKGVRVKIVDGVFSGREGLLISDCKEGNFAVRIDAIGLSLVTQIDRLLLQPVFVKDIKSSPQKEKKHKQQG